MSTWIIVNPAAGSGRAKRRGRELLDLLPGAQFRETRRAGHATELARQAREEGAEVIVPVGGDGTIQQCITGMCLDEQGLAKKHETKLALLPAGTGGDYRRTFNIGESVSQAASRILSPRLVPVDVGRVQYFKNGEMRVAAFLNVLSFGLGGLTDRFVEQGPKWLGGRAAFFMGALRATLVQQPIVTELTIDGKVVETAPFSNVALCNGQYFGGGMHIAPMADPSDGLFDIITMEMSRARTLGLSAHIYRGSHLKQQGVRHYRGRCVEARLTRHGESLIDADGEQVGALPLKIEVMKHAVQLIT